MKKLLPFLALAASVFAFPPAVSARPQDDDHGKHKGRYKHGDDDDDDGYRHDNGKHKGWYKHHDRDRKSTRLNSSHVSISYAVFCLKKKTSTKTNTGIKGT